MYKRGKTQKVLGYSLVFILLAVLVFAAVNLMTPTTTTFSNATNGTNTAISFTFNYTGNNATGTSVNCTLILGSKAAGINRTVQKYVNRTATIKLNQTVAQGRYTWNISCNRTGTVKSAVRSATNNVIIIDQTKPYVVLNAPAGGLNSSTAGRNITFSWTAIDKKWDTTLNCSLKINSIDNRTGAKAFSYNATQKNVNVKFGTDGARVWNVTCLDNATNRNISITRRLTIDTTPPKVFDVRPNRPISNYTIRDRIQIKANVTDSVDNVSKVYAVINWSSTTWVSGGTSTKRLVNRTGRAGMFNVSFLIPNVTGRYDVVFTANDTFNQINNTVKTFFRVNDTFDPRVYGIDYSVSSASANVLWSSDEAGNSSVNYAVGKGLGTKTPVVTYATSHAVSITGLDASTKYYFNVTTCDPYGNCIVNGTRNFTTSAVVSGGSGSGGGGSSTVVVPTEVPVESVAYTLTTSPELVNPYKDPLSASWTTIAANEPVVFNINEQSVPVTGVGFTTTSGSSGASMKVNALEVKPADTPVVPGKVYSYLDVTTTSITDGSIASAVINFRVAKSWLNANNIAPEKMVLYRLNNGVWQKLSTTILVQDSTNVYYKATTPGFSLFAISAEGAPADTAKETANAATTSTGQTAKKSSALQTVAIIVILLIVAYFLLKGRKKKN